MKQLFFFFLWPLTAAAQSLPFAAFKKYPFTTELCAAPRGSKIAWAMNEEGRRNIYVAEGPDFTPRAVTHFTKDDGEEISSLQISTDGKWIVFVRGGDHGANWDADAPVNPLADIHPFKVQVAAVPFAGGELKYLSEGDDPTMAPNNTVAFIKAGQVWTAHPDSNTSAKNLFTARGRMGELQWSPDGERLAFVSYRTGHSIIGLFHYGDSSVSWVAPAFSRDGSPRWSPDGTQLAFIRRPAIGGRPDSLLARKTQPWRIYTIPLGAEIATLRWSSPATLRGSYPTTDGSTNLHWAAGDHLVFLSYQDGWPHLYSLVPGHPAMPLTVGNFMCEHISLTADKKHLIFSANTGSDKLDIDRRHAAIVSIDKPDMRVLTNGDGLEWMPVQTGDGLTNVCISATTSRPPLPAILQAGKTMQVLAMDHLPADFPLQKFVVPQQVMLRAADGLAVHAQLFNAPGGPAQKPAIVYIHGGPPRQMLLGWNYSDYYANAYASNQYLASLGFVVISVNYRLGIGYGYEFHQPAHAGVTGAAEYKDIKAAGEWLQQQSFVDHRKIGLYGGSYGGFLTAMGLAKDSKIFAAGVDIHGVHDWVNTSGLMTAFDNSYEKAPDYEQALKAAWQSSPIAFMDGWKSPVLIIHGDDDRNVAFAQSLELIGRLDQKKIPYESLMIVDDTHHWMNYKNAVTVYGAVASYFMKKFK